MTTHETAMLGLQSHMNISNMVMTPLQIQQMQQLRQHQQQADMMYLQQHQQQAVVQQQQQQQQQQNYMHTHITSNGAQVNTHMATAAGMMSMAAPAMPVAAMAAPMMFPTLTSTDFASVAATAVPNPTHQHQHQHNPPMQMSRGPYIRVSDDTRAQILYLHNQTPSPSSASIARILKGQGLTVPDRTIRGIIQQSIKRFAEQQSRQVERQQRDQYINMQHQPQQQQSYQMQQQSHQQMLANKNRKRGRPAKVPSGVSSPPTTAMTGDTRSENMEVDIKRARTTDAAVSAPGSLAHSTASGGSTSSLVSTTAPSASAPYVFQLSLSWRVRGVEESMIPQIARMESDNYPADEACSLENFNYRLTHAAPFFKAAVSVPTFKHSQKDELSTSNTTTAATTAPSSTSTPSPASTTTASSSTSPPPVLGFVVGTLSAAAELHHESMFNHDPNGRYLCIHSVCVPLALQQQGLGRKLLLEYVRQVKQENAGRLNAIVLICKKHFVRFYQSCGFKLVGPSNVVHGAEPWYECRMELDNTSQSASNSNQTPLLAAIDAATNGSEQHSPPAPSSQSDMMAPEM